MYLILKFSRKPDRLLLPLAVQPVSMVSTFQHASLVLRFRVFSFGLHWVQDWFLASTR
jgi:hypothetical protein